MEYYLSILSVDFWTSRFERKYGEVLNTLSVQRTLTVRESITVPMVGLHFTGLDSTA